MIDDDVKGHDIRDRKREEQQEIEDNERLNFCIYNRCSIKLSILNK